MESAALAVIRDPVQAVALLQPERLKLLEALGAPDSASGLARRFELPRQRLNYHLKELEKAGLVELVEERRKGNCIERVVRATARRYVISPEVLGEIGQTREDATDRFSAAYLVGLAARVIRDVAGLMARATASKKRLATITIETDIRLANAEARAAFAEDLSQAIARLAEKYHDDNAGEGRWFRLIAASYPGGRK
jgi:DNA-binding transcriptional ArsR family regulator